MLRSEEEQKQTTTPTSMEVDHKIRDFKIAKDEAHISYYAGYVGELFWTVSFGKMWHPSSWSSWTWSPLGPVILIIRRARLQKPTDCYPLQISNSWNVKELIVNEDIAEINDLKKSLPADNTYGTQAK
ncbi:hypothetical protein P8452_32579 [Trifolium repens]|nr:hypothetical protein P8452_32579 [Trifolium repens]